MLKMEKIGKETKFASSTLIAVGSEEYEQAQSVEYYNPDSWSWSKLTDLDINRINFKSTMLGDKLMIIGGRISGYSVTTVESYDFSTRQLTTLAPMKQARIFQGVAVYSNELYTIGGYDDEYLNRVEKYNPTTNQWTELTPMPTTRGYCETTLHTANNEIYVMGGYNLEYLSIVEAYNPAQNSWRQCASMNQSRYGFAIASIGGFIYIAGGFNYSDVIGEVDRYDPITDSWSYVDNMGTPRFFCSGINFNEGFVVAGGADNNGKSSLVESYQDYHWNSMAPFPNPRAFFSLVEVPWQLVKRTLNIK